MDYVVMERPYTKEELKDKLKESDCGRVYGVARMSFNFLHYSKTDEMDAYVRKNVFGLDDVDHIVYQVIGSEGNFAIVNVSGIVNL